MLLDPLLLEHARVGRRGLLGHLGKPVALPASAGLYLDRVAGGWDIALRNMTKGYPHLTATVRAR